MKKSKIRCGAGLVAVLAAAAPALARESVCLTTGFCLTADSHTLAGDSYVLHTGGGTLEVPANQIAEITILAETPGEGVAGTAVAKTASAAEPANTAANYEEMLVKAAIAQGLEPDFVRSVARVESNLRQDAVSNKGAIGLMQLMPRTANGLGVNANDAGENILGGARFLRELLLKYNGNPALALAAYNAGPGAVEKYSGVPPYMETHKYIIRVLSEYKKLADARAREGASAKVKSTNATN